MQPHSLRSTTPCLALTLSMWLFAYWFQHVCLFLSFARAMDQVLPPSPRASAPPTVVEGTERRNYSTEAAAAMGQGKYKHTWKGRK